MTLRCRRPESRDGRQPGVSESDGAVGTVAEVTGECGSGAPQVEMNRPGDHAITASESYGGHYVFGTAANTVLLVSVGCHLPADAHPNVK